MKTRKLTMCSLFVALTAILSQIAIPIGAVPINLATFSVLCSGALLGAKYGAISQIVYMLIGAVGVPVFTMFGGGMGILFGPTGGYIVGYILSSWIVGYIVERFGNKIYFLALAMILGIVTYMTVGTLWFMYITKSSLWQSLITCVIPFLFGDILKAGLAATIVYRLQIFKLEDPLL